MGAQGWAGDSGENSLKGVALALCLERQEVWAGHGGGKVCQEQMGNVWGGGTKQGMCGERATGLRLAWRDEPGRVGRDLEWQLKSWSLASLGQGSWRVSDPGRALS